jgi:hypothetical protein
MMPVHNGTWTISRAITSLIRQTYPDWELIAVDDASTDDSYGRLQAWGDRDGRVHVFQSDENRGPGAARNLALTHATADLVAYLDCDDEFYPDFVAHAVGLSDHAGLSIFRYDCLAEGDDHARAQTWDPAPSGHLFFEQNVTVPLGVVHRRELWAKVGGFDETLWCEEDWEFWKRLARAGAVPSYIPIKSGLYRFHPGNRSRSPRVTPSQRAGYDASRALGHSIYGPPRRPFGRPVRKVAFASTRPTLGPADPATVAASNLVDQLAHSGFTCESFASVTASVGGVRGFLAARGLPHQSRDAVCGPFAARLTHARRGLVPVTFVELAVARADSDPASTFLAFYDKFLEEFRPDLLVTSCEVPRVDPIVRLAKRRDIPVVVPLLDRPCPDHRAYSNVDYCVVGSEESRRRYWEESGLACVVLPPPGDTPDTNRVFAEFFRRLGPQPGPPYIPG